MVFGGVAVVLVAVIYVVSPSFKSEDAIGAIGAVQKHRAPQIAQKDVILGGENAKKQQQIQYNDLLADATALQSISANMTTASRAESASRLAARSAEVAARYSAAAREQVAAMKSLLATDNLESAKLASIEIDGVSIGGSRSTLDSAQMNALNARLESAMAAVESALHARQVAAVEADVAGLAARVQSRENVDGVRATMAAVTRNLDARTNAATLRAREEQLSAMAKESAVLQSAEEALNTGSRSQSAVQAELGSAAQELSQRSLMGMRSNFAMESATVESLGHMAEAAGAMTRAAASRSDAPLGFRSEVAEFAQRLQARSNAARESFNTAMQAQLVGMTAYLASARQFDARTANAADFASYLGTLSRAAESRSALYASILGNQDFAAETRALSQKAAILGAQSQNLKSRNQ